MGKSQNLKELEKLKENQIAVIGNIGKKKKIEIAKKAREMKIKIHNMNPEKYLKIADKKGKKEERKK